MVTTIFENHALAMDVVKELLDHSTIHPKRELISSLKVRTMTLERLYKESQILLEELKDYPNIIVLKEYVHRMGYFVEDR